MSDDGLEKLHAELDERGIELSDDCGRETEDSVYVGSDLRDANDRRALGSS